MRVGRLLVCIVGLLLGVASLALAQPAGERLLCSSNRRGATEVVLTATGGQVANGDSLNWISTGATRHSIAVQYIIAPTATVELFQSIDNGATFDNVPASSRTTSDILTIENPIGIYKTTVSGFAGGNVVVQVTCGPSVGGRP